MLEPRTDLALQFHVMRGLMWCNLRKREAKMLMGSDGDMIVEWPPVSKTKLYSDAVEECGSGCSCGEERKGADVGEVLVTIGLMPLQSSSMTTLMKANSGCES